MSKFSDDIYNVNDIVYASDNDKLYLAKIIKVQDLDGIRKYFIHYNNWNRKYDVWLDGSSIASKNDEKKIEKLNHLLKNKNSKESHESNPTNISNKRKLKDKDSNSELKKSNLNSDSNCPEVESNSLEEDQCIKSNKLSIDLINSSNKKKYNNFMNYFDIFNEINLEYDSKLIFNSNLKKILYDDWLLITTNSYNNLIKEFNECFHSSSQNNIYSTPCFPSITNNRLVKLPKPKTFTIKNIILNYIDKLKKSEVENEEEIALIYGIIVQFNNVNIYIF